MEIQEVISWMQIPKNGIVKVENDVVIVVKVE